MAENAICLHAWAYELDGNGNPTQNEEYCDPAERAPDGWCVYTRVDADTAAGGPGWDIAEEMDFDSLDDAMREAHRRANITGFPVQEY